MKEQIAFDKTLSKFFSLARSSSTHAFDSEPTIFSRSIKIAG